jgi:hypothetical protein
LGDDSSGIEFNNDDQENHNAHLFEVLDGGVNLAKAALSLDQIRDLWLHEHVNHLSMNSLLSPLSKAQLHYLSNQAQTALAESKSVGSRSDLSRKQNEILIKL